MVVAEVLTPDFYEYEWLAPATVRADGEVVVVEWADGCELRAYSWWLRENFVGEGAIDPITREGTLDPSFLPTDLAIATAVLDDDGAVSVGWRPDGLNGRFHPGWLRHVAEARHHVASDLPSPTNWTAATLDELPTFSGASLGDVTAFFDFADALVRFGVARLTGVPTEPDAVGSVATRFGPLRDSNFGLVWSVKAEITGDDENTTANTTFRLGPHTDLPTRETPPGFQFLHCLENRCAGGSNRMVDGEALVAFLEHDEPDTYEALTTLRWVFSNRSRHHDHRWSAPMVERDSVHGALTLRAFYPLRAFPDMAEADVPVAYRAVRRFHELAADESFQIGFRFEPGDLVGFDNRRILHARDEFDNTTGRRHLRGCYVDHDDVYSRLRVLSRRSGVRR